MAELQTCVTTYKEFILPFTFQSLLHIVPQDKNIESMMKVQKSSAERTKALDNLIVGLID